jgi:hypothetical protein
MTLAHVAGVPLEELPSLAPAAGAAWLVLRMRVRREPGWSPAQAVADTRRENAVS